MHARAEGMPMLIVREGANEKRKHLDFALDLSRERRTAPAFFDGRSHFKCRVKSKAKGMLCGKQT